MPVRGQGTAGGVSGQRPTGRARKRQLLGSGGVIGLCQSDVFQDDSPEDLRVAEALEGIQDLDAGQLAVRGVIGAETPPQMPGRYGGP